MTWVIRSWSLIFGERPERIANGRLFLVSDLSDSLIPSLLTKNEGMSKSLGKKKKNLYETY